MREIRHATKVDTGAIFDLLETVYHPSPWTYMQVEISLSSPHEHTFQMVDGTELLGLVTVLDLGEEVEILQVATHPDHRHRGVASCLLTAALQDKRAFLEVRENNRAAISLYKSFGFVAVGHRPYYYHNPREDAIIMRKE